MTYIKLLTALAGLALLTACGGAAAPKTDNTGDTGEVNTTDCTATPFDTNCDAVESAITSRQTTCFASATANRRCGVVIEGACRADPFSTETACMADTYLPNRIAECIKGGEADEGKCATITTDAEKNTMLTSCLKNPFDIVCKMTVADFATYTDTARMNRLDFCDNSGNVADDLCTGNNVAIICSVDPFNAICFTDDTYIPNRVNNCIMVGNAGESKCNTLLSDATMNTELTACLTNPFATACESVPAFTSFALARTNRASFCDNSDNITNTLCMGDVVSPICELDPTNAICTDAIYLSARLADCIKTENTEAEKCNTLLSDATMNAEITACLANPFSSACEADSDFMTYAETAQTNRGSFCDMAGNDTKALCMGANLMGVCGIDSFNAICFTDKTYLPVRLGECIKTENAEDMRCNTLLSDATMNTTITNCLTNPFSDACKADGDFGTYADMARTNRESFCEMMGNESKAPCTALTACQGNPFGAGCGAYFESAKIPHCGIRGNKDNNECTTTLSNPTSATWLQSFATALSTTPATTDTPQHGYLSMLRVNSACDVHGSLRLSNNSAKHQFGRVP